MRRTMTAIGKRIATGWTCSVHLAVGAPLGVLISNLIQTAGLFALIASAVVWPMRRQARGAVFEVAHLCSVVQCTRFRVMLREQITPAEPRNVSAGWRQVWYHLLVAFNICVIGTILVLGLWSAAFACVLLPVFTTPDTSPFGLTLWDPLVRTGMSLLSVVLAVGAVLLAPLLVRLDVYAARAMMEASRTEELEQRVVQLSHSRAEVVGAADAERRRIERDLHDGAQQRLVSLAINLGLARAELSRADTVDGDAARRVIEHAHEEAKQALAELRELVRGLHPAVLHDRGLDAALSGIAARSPVPARLTVEMQARPSPTVEAVAYFVVAEALSNVAKHSRAASVQISVRGSDSVLRIEIRDDGIGGADPSLGTGLRGLAQRVSSVDGAWQVSSPTGGPTVITVELPCGW